MKNIRSFAFICALLVGIEAHAVPMGVARGAGVTDQVRQLALKAGIQPDSSAQTVKVIIEGDLDQEARSAIPAHRGLVRYSLGRRHEVDIPAGMLSALIERLPADVFVRLPFPHQPMAVTGQGVAKTGASDMHALGNGGAGVTVGVIDLGFAGLSTSQTSGDLPQNLTAVDYTGKGIGGINHGTNVAEIVADMAPNAGLYLAKVETTVQLEQAVYDMIAAGVRVINHSVGWFGASFYDGTGVLCDITSMAEAAGIQWVNSAGNSRNAHYLGQFSDLDGNLRHEFAQGQNHNTISLTAGSSVQLILNWDAYPTTNIDYNLYLYNGNPSSGGVVVASSATRQNGSVSSVPYEVIVYTPQTTGTYYIVVSKTAVSTASRRITLFSTGPSLGVKTLASSLAGPADCDHVVTVAAVNLSDVVESYSSEGPTTDGRLKPELAAPNRVQTSLSAAFSGTSAASPHVAGAAALLLAQDPTRTLAQLRAQLTGGSHDLSPAGFDYRTGSGRLSLDADTDGLNHDDDNCDLAYNPAQADLDGDGIGNSCDDDADGDGLSAAAELAAGTNPLNADTDGDTLSDAQELASGLNPLNPDTDGDGLSDAQDAQPLIPNYANGDVAPIGAPDGVVDAADYAVMERIVLGRVNAGIHELAYGDLYPPGAPDGVLDLSDLILFRKLVHLPVN